MLAVDYLPIALNLEDRFDLDRDAERQRAYADCAAGADARLTPENLGKQFAATVDHRRLLRELERAIDHAQHFHHAVDAFEAAQRIADQNRRGRPGCIRTPSRRWSKPELYLNGLAKNACPRYKKYSLALPVPGGAPAPIEVLRQARKERCGHVDACIISLFCG